MNEVVYFFGGWDPVIRIVVLGVLMYVALVLILRISGSRTLASMSAFDFIVTVAIGAVFGRTLTTQGVALVESLTALALLVALQFIVTWLQTRWPVFKGVLTNPPSLLYFRGTFLRDTMLRQRVTEEEIMGAVRKEQTGSMKEVEAVVLETSGSFSVIRAVGDGSALGKGLREQIERQTGRETGAQRTKDPAQEASGGTCGGQSSAAD
ncbi:MAG: DUF421 domain-containing protein [Gemmatimonadales bacterium]|nr:MAG: DUF421 domain-containing protein [Gemmatimonadales bacterium]